MRESAGVDTGGAMITIRKCLRNKQFLFREKGLLFGPQRLKRGTD
jgi:hypothetical protein